jgi:hypothetical protein
MSFAAFAARIASAQNNINAVEYLEKLIALLKPRDRGESVG